MKTIHKLKLSKYRQQVHSKRVMLEQATLNGLLKEQTERVSNAFEKLSEAVDGIKEFTAAGIKVENIVNIEGLEKIPEAIEKIKLQPNISVKGPVVNVTPVLVNEDIYARYKRANSSVEGNGTYHGFIDDKGNWFIQLESGTDKSAKSRYAVGIGGFIQQWANRLRLEYKLLDEVNIP